MSYFLEGPRVALRPVAAEDVALFHTWINDPIVTHYMFFGQKPATREAAAKILDGWVGADSHAVFAVVDKRHRRTIGLAGLYDIHPTARKAEYRILLGDRAVWNTGYGTEVTRLLTWYGFDRLNLNRLWLGVTHENLGGVRAYEKGGYRREGVLRQDIYRNGRYYDSVRMSILREDYYPTRASKDAAFFSRKAKGAR